MDGGVGRDRGARVVDGLEGALPEGGVVEAAVQGMGVDVDNENMIDVSVAEGVMCVRGGDVVEERGLACARLSEDCGRLAVVEKAVEDVGELAAAAGEEGRGRGLPWRKGEGAFIGIGVGGMAAQSLSGRHRCGPHVLLRLPNQDQQDHEISKG